jgi:hypothetical protein
LLSIVAPSVLGDGNRMTIVLLAVGLLATAAGFVTIGFGIPINAFSLGNTLIIAGTIAVAGGLILVGLAIAIGQLRKIAETLVAQPRAARAESAEALPIPRMTMAAAGSSAMPGRPPSAKSPEPVISDLEPLHASDTGRTAEPRPNDTPFAGAAEAPPLDWLRIKSKPATPGPLAEPPMVEVHDEAPLSPRPSQRPAMPAAAQPSDEPKVWSPSRDTTETQATAAPRVDQPMPRATPQVEAPKEKDRFGFDLVWPDRAAATGEPAKREPALDMPIPPVPVRPRESRPVEKRAEPAARKPAIERGPAILKSGVIDGMPYTLYADGSIEAQLPQGTVKFASVDALRAHLEKQS